jgi:4-amino-4-deoxy-L-arabinose transferase-like glycosyltransferase
LPATVPILLGWLLTVTACYAAGSLLLLFVPVELQRQERHFFCFVCGASCFSLLIFALTVLQLAYPAVLILSAVSTILAALLWRPKASLAVPPPDFPFIWKAVFWSSFAVFGVYYFVHALAPEYSPDGTTYHLGLVGRYLRQHGFGRITTDMYANLSEAIEMLFLVAYSVGKHSAAALVEFSFLLALPFGMLSYARRIGYPKAGVFAALVVYTSPVFGMSGTVAYNDAAGTCILFALFYLLQIWAETRQHRLIPLIGLTAGFCYGAKYTLFLALPFAGLFLLWKLWRDRKPFFRPLILYSACALLMAAPWMAKDWLTVANPFSPFANRIFRNPYVTISFEQEYSTMMKNREGLPPWSRPFDHIVLGGRTSGLLGPLFLLTPFALLALRFRAGRQTLLAAAVFILPAYTNVETRFLMPMAPFLALSLGLAFAAVPYAIPVLLAFHLLTVWPSHIGAYAAPYAWILTDFEPAEAFRIVPEEQTLLRRLPGFAVAQLLERATPPGARILSYNNPPEAYTSREIIVKYESAFGNLLGEILWAAIHSDFQPKQQLSFHFTGQSVRKLRIVQTATHPTEVWRVSEIHVRNHELELRPGPEWRFSSSVNPWDLPLAFDGKDVTRWSTAEPIRPGMFIELDLGHSQELTSVELDSIPEWAPRLELYTQRASGQWTPLSTKPQISGRSVSATLRADATATLKSYGITHLLIAPDNFGVDDFLTKQKEWGIEEIGEANGSRLYKLL